MIYQSELLLDDRYEEINLLYRNEILVGYHILKEYENSEKYSVNGINVGSKKSDVEAVFGNGISCDFNSVNYYYNTKTDKLIDSQDESEDL